MKKIFLIFSVLLFANVSIGWGAFFHADSVEKVIGEYFPQEKWEDAALEYQAQMNPTTGEIDTNGFMNFCYAGGIDVATEAGVDECVQIANAATETCVYVGTGTRAGKAYIDYYKDGGLKVCVFQKAIGWATDVSGWEKGFQYNPKDPGNCICKNMKPIIDTETGKCKPGGTKFGITTCSSELSRDCVKDMDDVDALEYYWTHYFMKYRYWDLPVGVQAVVMQLAMGGTGVVAHELKQAIKCTDCGSNAVLDDITIARVKEYVEKYGSDTFNKNITEERVKTRKNHPLAESYEKRARDAYNDLKNAHIKCEKNAVNLKQSTAENKKVENKKVDNGENAFWKKINEWTKTTATYWKSHQYNEKMGWERGAFADSVRRMFDQIKQYDGLQYLADTVTIVCSGLCHRLLDNPDYVTCTITSANKKITKQYEYKDICDGRLKDTGIKQCSHSISVNKNNTKSLTKDKFELYQCK